MTSGDWSLEQQGKSAASIHHNIKQPNQKSISTTSTKSKEFADWKTIVELSSCHNHSGSTLSRRTDSSQRPSTKTANSITLPIYTCKVMGDRSLYMARHVPTSNLPAEHQDSNLKPLGFANIDAHTASSYYQSPPEDLYPLTSEENIPDATIHQQKNGKGRSKEFVAAFTRHRTDLTPAVVRVPRRPQHEAGLSGMLYSESRSADMIKSTNGRELLSINELLSSGHKMPPFGHKPRSHYHHPVNNTLASISTNATNQSQSTDLVPYESIESTDESEEDDGGDHFLEDPEEQPANDSWLKKWKYEDPEICCICLDEGTAENNAFVYCDNPDCEVIVHQECYAISKRPGPDDTWLCDRCQAIKANPAEIVSCAICPNKHGAFRRLDSFHQIPGWIHVVCGTWMPNVHISDAIGIKGFDIRDISEKNWTYKCYLCPDQESAEQGACVRCDAHGCKKTFHVTCAQKYSLLEEEEKNADKMVDPYFTYCIDHSSNHQGEARLNSWEQWVRQRDRYLLLKNEEAAQQRCTDLWQRAQRFTKFDENFTAQMIRAGFGFRELVSDRYATFVKYMADAIASSQSAVYQLEASNFQMEEGMSRLDSSLKDVTQRIKRTEKRKVELQKEVAKVKAQREKEEAAERQKREHEKDVARRKSREITLEKRKSELKREISRITTEIAMEEAVQRQRREFQKQRTEARKFEHTAPFNENTPEDSRQSLETSDDLGISRPIPVRPVIRAATYGKTFSFPPNTPPVPNGHNEGQIFVKNPYVSPFDSSVPAINTSLPASTQPHRTTDTRSDANQQSVLKKGIAVDIVDSNAALAPAGIVYHTLEADDRQDDTVKASEFSHDSDEDISIGDETPVISSKQSSEMPALFSFESRSVGASSTSAATDSKCMAIAPISSAIETAPVIATSSSPAIHSASVIFAPNPNPIAPVTTPHDDIDETAQKIIALITTIFGHNPIEEAQKIVGADPEPQRSSSKSVEFFPDLVKNSPSIDDHAPRPKESPSNAIPSTENTVAAISNASATPKGAKARKQATKPPNQRKLPKLRKQAKPPEQAANGPTKYAAKPRKDNSEDAHAAVLGAVAADKSASNAPTSVTPPTDGLKDDVASRNDDASQNQTMNADALPESYSKTSEGDIVNAARIAVRNGQRLMQRAHSVSKAISDLYSSSTSLHDRQDGSRTTSVGPPTVVIEDAATSSEEETPSPINVTGSPFYVSSSPLPDSTYEKEAVGVNGNSQKQGNLSPTAITVSSSVAEHEAVIKSEGRATPSHTAVHEITSVSEPNSGNGLDAEDQAREASSETQASQPDALQADASNDNQTVAKRYRAPVMPPPPNSRVKKVLPGKRKPGRRRNPLFIRVSPLFPEKQVPIPPQGGHWLQTPATDGSDEELVTEYIPVLGSDEEWSDPPPTRKRSRKSQSKSSSTLPNGINHEKKPSHHSQDDTANAVQESSSGSQNTNAINAETLPIDVQLNKVEPILKDGQPETSALTSGSLKRKWAKTDKTEEIVKRQKGIQGKARKGKAAADDDEWNPFSDDEQRLSAYDQSQDLVHSLRSSRSASVTTNSDIESRASSPRISALFPRAPSPKIEEEQTNQDQNDQRTSRTLTKTQSVEPSSRATKATLESLHNTPSTRRSGKESTAKISAMGQKTSSESKGKQVVKPEPKQSVQKKAVAKPTGGTQPVDSGSTQTTEATTSRRTHTKVQPTTLKAHKCTECGRKNVPQSVLDSCGITPDDWKRLVKLAPTKKPGHTGNGKDWDPNTLIECETCKRFYHCGCTDPPVRNYPQRGVIFRCEDCDEVKELLEEEIVVDRSDQKRLRDRQSINYHV